MTAIRADWKQPVWDGRVKLMAALVPAGTRVIDLGAGAQTLQKYLPARCTYDAADIDGPLVLDFDRDVYPDGEWDVAVMSGALEYSPHPGQALKAVARLAPSAVVSFSSGGALAYRRRLGWRAHLSRAGFEQLVLRAGMSYELADRWRGHLIYKLERA